MPTTTSTKTSTTETKRRARSRENRAPRRRPARRRGRGNALPRWRDRTGAEEGAAPLSARFWAGLSTLRFALLVAAVAGACVLYIGHVHATQALLGEVERARAANQRLHLEKSRLQSAYDQATAPSVIYRRAEALGLEEGLSRGPTIYVGSSGGDASVAGAAPGGARRP